jgi:ribosome maturation factor RimP
LRRDDVAGLEAIIREYVKIKNIDLVDLVYRYEGRNLILRLLVDYPQGGITLDECARLNIEISKILDEREVIQERYILEVSSPGIDRPLVSKNDFLRCINRDVWFLFPSPLKGKIELRGLIKSVKDDSVEIEVENQILEIPFGNITKAKQILE